MPVCGNYLFFELPKKIVLNPKDGAICGLVDQWILRFHNFDLAEILFGQCECQQLPAKRRVAHDQREDKVIGEGQKIRVWFQIDR